MRSIHIVFISFVMIPTTAFAQIIPTSQTPQQNPDPLIGEIHGQIEAGWYASSDVYKYVADINLNFDFGSWNNAKLNFLGGVQTLIKGDNGDGFNPYRYRGTLQPTIYWANDNSSRGIGIRHQSFHAIDHEPVFGEQDAYQILFAAYQHFGMPNYRLELGTYFDKTEVDYQWEVTAAATTAGIGSCRYGPIYVEGMVHFVKENKSLSSRSGFWDYGVETGIQTRTGLRYFAAYRRLHDVDKFNGTTDDQVLVGVKYLW